MTGLQRGTPRAVGAYIFAGGFTHGVMAAGFDVRAQLEDGPFGVKTSRRNHPGVPVHEDPKSWPIAALLAESVDFLFANPPCAPFSIANTSSKKLGAAAYGDWWKRDARTACISTTFSLLEALRPTIWAWESVQLAAMRGRELVEELTEAARVMGYTATWILINAADLGVPQVRRRFFCVFHKVAIDWQYPAYPRIWRTVREALAGIAPGAAPRTQQRIMDFMKHMLPGDDARTAWERMNPPETWKKNPKTGAVIGRMPFANKRLRWDRPANVVMGGEAHLIHPDEDRFITLPEAQALCSYPPSYEFMGPERERFSEVARAVMPTVGQWLGENVKRALEDGIPADGITRLVNLEKGTTEIIRDADGRRPVPPAYKEVPNGRGGTMLVSIAAKDMQPCVPKAAREPRVADRLPVVEALANNPTFAGPTLLARHLIAEGHDDGAILATTRAAFGPGTDNPKMFTKSDLQRLRARIIRNEPRKENDDATTPGVAGNGGLSGSGDLAADAPVREAELT